MFSHRAQGNKWSWSKDTLKSGFLILGQKKLWQLQELSLTSVSGGQALTPGPPGAMRVWGVAVPVRSGCGLFSLL